MQQLKASSSEVPVARISCDVHLEDSRSKAVFPVRFGLGQQGLIAVSCHLLFQHHGGKAALSEGSV